MATESKVRFFFGHATKRENRLAGFVLLIILTVFAGLFFMFAAPIYRAQKMYLKYEQIEKGMSYSSVIDSLGIPDSEEKGWFNRGFWDEEALPEEEVEKIRKEIQYGIYTFPVGVWFNVSFDEDDKVVGKHRSD